MSQTPISDFYAAHGGREATITVGNYIWFPDGAMLENNQWGAMIEPPANELERQKQILRYREKFLERAETKYAREYNEIEACIRNAERGGTHMPDHHAINRLKEMKVEVVALRLSRDEAQSKLDILMAPTTKERKRLEQQHQASVSCTIKELQKLKP